MTYIPTKEELEELGFKGDGFLFKKKGIRYVVSRKMWHIGSFDIRYEFYPQSLDDIKTLIRILTPQ